MMRLRQKTHRHLYPNWRSKKLSPSVLCKERDNQACVACGQRNRTLILDEQGRPSHFEYLHAAHIHRLDPLFHLVAPINGQRLRAMCPHCHRVYDDYWEQRDLEQRTAAQSRPGADWILQRFLEVV